LPNKFLIRKVRGCRIDENHKVLSIVEKPEHPKSNYAVVGFYIYDNRVVEYAKSLKPSARNELEIVDLHNKYLVDGDLDVKYY